MCCIKLNSDGSLADDGAIGGGMVLRDVKARIILLSYRELFSCREALEVELYVHVWEVSLSLSKEVTFQL